MFQFLFSCSLRQIPRFNFHNYFTSLKLVLLLAQILYFQRKENEETTFQILAKNSDTSGKGRVETHNLIQTLNLTPILTLNLTPNLTLNLTRNLTLNLTLKLTPYLTLNLTLNLSLNLTLNLNITP